MFSSYLSKFVTNSNRNPVINYNKNHTQKLQKSKSNLHGLFETLNTKNRIKGVTWVGFLSLGRIQTRSKGLGQNELDYMIDPSSF